MSEWRERANKRRDERHTALPEIRPPASTGKNTKRWCRGKVGREHMPRCVSYNDLKNVTWGRETKVLLCDRCGKHLDYWWAGIFGRGDRQPPEWVTVDATKTVA